MDGRPGAVTTFWTSLSTGPWREGVVRRMTDALSDLVSRLASLDGLVALIVYGSYARGGAGKTSDLDLLVLFETDTLLQRQETDVLTLISQAEAEARLPVHLSPLLASMDRLEELGDTLLHEIATDGVVLYGHLPVLARLLPQHPKPAVVITFTLKGAPPADRMRLNRRLHGYSAWRERDGHRERVTYPGLITPPARSLGSGVLLVPGELRSAIVEALTDVGALYTETPVWVVE